MPCNAWQQAIERRAQPTVDMLIRAAPMCPILPSHAGAVGTGTPLAAHHLSEASQSLEEEPLLHKASGPLGNMPLGRGLLCSAAIEDTACHTSEGQLPLLVLAASARQRMWHVQPCANFVELSWRVDRLTPHLTSTAVLPAGPHIQLPSHGPRGGARCRSSSAGTAGSRGGSRSLCRGGRSWGRQHCAHTGAGCTAPSLC